MWRGYLSAVLWIVLCGCPKAETTLPASAEDVTEPADPGPAVDDPAPIDVPPPDPGPDPDPGPESDPGPELPDTPPDTEPEIEDASPPVTVDLVDMYAFVVADPADDPFYGDGEYADEWQCEPEYYKAETTEVGDQFDIETSFCGYVSIVQPLAVAVPKDAEIAITIHHWAITEADDGVFTLAAAMGDPPEVVWERELEVPLLDIEEFTETWTASRDYEQAEPIWFHISNHGDNNWALKAWTATY